MNSLYCGLDYIKAIFNKQYRADGFNGNTLAEYELWKKGAIPLLAERLSIDKMESVPLEPKTVSVDKTEDYIREKIVISTQERLKMPFYRLVPNKPNGKSVIAVHGHGSDGKEGLLGREREAYRPKIFKYNYSYALELVSSGYTVYLPDLLGSGERMIGLYDAPKTECNDINNACISLGLSLQGIIVFDLIRLVDYIVEYDGYKGPLGCVGFSAGGFSTLLLTALDERVSYAVVSGYFHSFKDTLIYTNRCGCNFVPQLWNSLDMGDIGAMIAPRPLYIETGEHDGLNGSRGIEGAKEQLELARKVYKLYDTDIEFEVKVGEHQWYGSCYDWIDKVSDK
jgi:hypothetical protein